MLNSPIKEGQEKRQELNTLNVLIQSLKYQIGDLNSVNNKIDNLKLKLQGGLNTEEKGEKE